MSAFRRRPGDTKQGEVLKDPGGRETTEFKDAVLFDFDIDDDTPKEAHLEYLREVIRYMVRVLNVGSGRAFVIHLDGFASRTGGAQHNDFLSTLREQAIENQLRTALDLKPDLKPLVTFNRKFHGFADSPPGENAHFRAVRIVVTRPGPPPKPVPIPTGSKFWEVRLVTLLSLGIPVVIIPGAEIQVDAALFEIVDRSPGGKQGLFRYVGGGVAVGVPKLGPVSGGPLGNFTLFSTTDPVGLRDFEGDASFLQPPAIGPIGDSFLAIQNRVFLLKETHTIPDPIPVDSFSFIPNIFESTSGSLTLLRINGRPV
ncbi:MAG: hypothetical protein V7604_2052 [Hyphomicrobiales bacterium]